MLTPFELLGPETLDEAVRLIVKYGEACKIMAGGTDVLVSMHAGTLKPDYIVDIKGIKELRGKPVFSETGLSIAALSTHDEIEMTSEVKKYYTALWEGAAGIGSVQTRMRGTIGGNICNAIPSGDSLGPLLALDASLTVFGPGGRRSIEFEEFFTGPGKTTLKPGEILCSIDLPPPRPRSGSAYLKFTRRKAMDLMLSGVTANISLDEHGLCEHVRIALSAAAPVPIRAKTAEKYLRGKIIDKKAMAEAARLAAKDAKPRSSWRTSAAYRYKLIETLLPRAIELSLSRAGEQPLTEAPGEAVSG